MGRFLIAGATLALLAVSNSTAEAWGGAGYYGGSSGGIPGTGEWSYYRGEPARMLCAPKAEARGSNPLWCANKINDLRWITLCLYLGR